MIQFKKARPLMSLIVGAGIVGVFLNHSSPLFAQSQGDQSREITIIHEDDSQHVVMVSPDENVTIAILKETLEGKTDEEIDAYFAHFESDDQRILADEYGGLMSLKMGYEGDGDLGYVVKPDGTKTHYNLYSPEATTVGEAKEALKTANN